MKTFLRVLSIIFLIAWMGLIFYFSSQTATESSAVSGGVIDIVAAKLYDGYNALSETEKQEIVASLQDIVRKAAHYCIYGGLGFFAFLTFVSYVKLKFKTRIFWMLFVSLTYSVSDEFHQHFVEGRSAQLIDIAVDAAGILTAIILCFLFVVIIRPLYRKLKYVPKRRANQIASFRFQEQIEKEIERYKTERETLVNKPYDVQQLPEIKEIKMEEKIENIPETEPLSEVLPIEEKSQNEAAVDDGFNLAAQIIGKTVIEATKACNELSSGEQSSQSLELVNLILGRTEVLKAEVLNILQSETDLETKKALMQSEQESAFDYFNSIKAQSS